jgi:deoxyadenosine/deoxycytidine kinase
VRFPCVLDGGAALCFCAPPFPRGPELPMPETAASPTDRLRYVVVEGPIGVGKSTLTRLLIDQFQGRGVFEVVEENPFLASFYSDRDKYAFQTQLFFLLSRFRQQQALFQDDLFSHVLVSDYLFAKDRIFATITLDPNELALYERVYENIAPRVRKPDLVVYLRARIDVLLARIKKRGREFERRFDPEYLEELCSTYNDFFFRYDETPLLVVDTSEIDFVASDDDFREILGAITKMKKGTVHLQPGAR